MSTDLGYVYVIQAEEGPVKIGISIHPDDRINAIESASGRHIVRTFISPLMEGYAQLEKNLHKHFASSRTRGEWFNIDFAAAVRAAHTLGAAMMPQEWTTTADYVQGAAHRQRMFGFHARGPHSAEAWTAFLDGMGDEAQRQIDYADQVDVILGSRVMARLDEIFVSLAESSKIIGLPIQVPDNVLKMLNDIQLSLHDDMREAGMQVEPFWGS